jgi:hypothetical protein
VGWGGGVEGWVAACGRRVGAWQPASKDKTGQTSAVRGRQAFQQARQAQAGSGSHVLCAAQGACAKIVPAAHPAQPKVHNLHRGQACQQVWLVGRC